MLNDRLFDTHDHSSDPFFPHRARFIEVLRAGPRRDGLLVDDGMKR